MLGRVQYPCDLLLLYPALLLLTVVSIVLSRGVTAPERPAFELSVGSLDERQQKCLLTRSPVID